VICIARSDIDIALEGFDQRVVWIPCKGEGREIDDNFFPFDLSSIKFELRDAGPRRGQHISSLLLLKYTHASL
jgi:hypothetical protein